KTGKLLIVEEHNIWGGAGESISRIVAENHPVFTKIVGIDDTFGESGSHRKLWEKYKIDRVAIASQIREII
ncbi:MAG TPA: transketolase C-terminal domain-containing protein, partial [Candidatus Dojkabacteria bacterium]|nr:transketolase C-terminal domain-containing protein [Candidatus Dojkabacteria bacterium]